MRRLITFLSLVAPLATAACGYTPKRPPPEGTVPAPAGLSSGPACRVWDEDMYGRRYCRVRYVYGHDS